MVVLQCKQALQSKVPWFTDVLALNTRSNFASVQARFKGILTVNSWSLCWLAVNLTVTPVHHRNPSKTIKCFFFLFLYRLKKQDMTYQLVSFNGAGGRILDTARLAVPPVFSLCAKLS